MLPLVCLDVDGTLVGPTGEVTTDVWAAADAARARGQHLAVCTARGAFGSAWEMASRLDPEGWHVFHAGAAIVHTGTGDVRSAPLSDNNLDQVATVAADHGWTVEYYTATDYSVDHDDEFAIDHAALLGVPFRRRSRAELVGPVVRVQFVVPESDIDAIAAVTPKGLHLTSATSPVMPGAAFVTMIRSGVDKGTGIATIAAELGIDLGGVMMVGDGLNDLSALAAVGHPVAMGNAAPEVRTVSRYIVADVRADGAAEALVLSARLGDN